MVTARRPRSSLGVGDGYAAFSSPSVESLLAPSEATTAPSRYRSAKSSLSPTDFDETDPENEDSFLSLFNDDLPDLPDAPLPVLVTAFPSPPSLSTLSGSSSTETTFQLSSPFPRVCRPTPVAHPPHLHQHRASHDKENAAPSSRSATPTLAPHIRIQSKPSTVGFPHVASILATTDSLVDVRGAGSISSLAPRKRRYELEQGASSDDGSDESERGSSSEGDVDLELSFDFRAKSPAPSGRGSFDSLDRGTQLEASQVTGRVKRADWVEIPVSDGASSRSSSSSASTFEFARTAHTVPANELVRSESGQLLGTRRRVRSAIELRAAFLAAELGPEAVSSFAISMSPESDVEAADKPRARNGRMASPARAEWARRTNRNPSLQLGGESPRVPSPAQSQLELLGGGFAFNPTDPLNVPLPDSPVSPATPDPDRCRKVLLLPLKILDHPSHSQPPSAGLASPAWSIASLLRGQAPGTAADGEVLPRQPGWAETAKRGVLGYLGRRQPPTSEASPQFSQGFDSPRGSDGTATTTPELSPTFPLPSPSPSASSPSSARRKYSKPAFLAGLGLAFGDESEPEPDDVAPPPTGRVPLAQRRQHPAIPSLSISPPPRSERDSTSDCGDDPARSSLARRLARQLGGGDARVAQLHDRNSLLPTSAATSPRSPTADPQRLHLVSDSISRSRFAFTPAPLNLVEDQLLRTAGYGVAEPTWHRRHPSIVSLKELVVAYPGSVVDEMVPAKLLFLLGFFLGPWCWILGGWWLRGLDGELWSTHGTRCRETGCSCGRIVQWHSLAASRRHGTADKLNARAVDDWVFVNRAATVTSGASISALFIVALWAAASA